MSSLRGPFSSSAGGRCISQAAVRHGITGYQPESEFGRADIHQIAPFLPFHSYSEWSPADRVTPGAITGNLFSFFRKGLILRRLRVCFAQDSARRAHVCAGQR
jgi:hypothetical protein